MTTSCPAVKAAAALAVCACPALREGGASVLTPLVLEDCAELGLVAKNQIREGEHVCLCIAKSWHLPSHFFRETFRAERLAAWNGEKRSTAPALTWLVLECVSSASSAADMGRFPVTFTAEQLQKDISRVIQRT